RPRHVVGRSQVAAWTSRFVPGGRIAGIAATGSSASGVTTSWGCPRVGSEGIMARVLVVDDEPAVRTVIVEMLESNGPAAAAAGGAEAASTLQKQWFDALVTDIVMPDVSGWDLIEIARQRVPPMAVVAISGGGRFLRQEAALKISEAFGA